MVSGAFREANWRLNAFVVALVPVLCLFFALPAHSQEAALLPPDVRLVIDVSGSMKGNDPNNLRQPAVELLVQLLPENSKSGVWTFGKWVNMLVPHQKVDLAWRESAQQKSQEINSLGLFTNIGEALEKAAYDINQTESSYRKSIILLTDGMVDIDKDPDANSREWRRIVDEVLPRLQAAGFTIHTIALSDNADTNLLGKLSLATDGLAEVAHSADELMRIFLKTFDVAAPAELVPLKDNVFVIDSSIEEFTALIFRNNPQETTELIGPDTRVSRVGKLQEGIKWHSTKEYDLITVNQPLEGEWTVKADMAPESRVTVVSNLNLRVRPLPNNVYKGQSLDLKFALFEDGKIIIRPEFLSLMKVDVSMLAGVNKDDLQPIWSEDLSRSAPPASGNYQTRFPDFDRNGQYQVEIVLDGKTFVREFRHHMSVRQPFAMEIKEEFREGKIEHILTIRSFGNEVDTSSTEVFASILTPDDSKKFVPLTATDMDTWRGLFEPTSEGEYVAQARIKGQTKDGQEFDIALENLSFMYSLDGGLNETPESFFPDSETLKESPQQDKEVQTEITSDPASEPEQKPNKAESRSESKINSWILYGALGIANLVLLVLGFLLYKKFMRTENDEDILEEFSEEKITEAKTAAFEEPVANKEQLDDQAFDSEPIDDEPPMEDLEPAMEDLDPEMEDIESSIMNDEPAMEEIDLEAPAEVNPGSDSSSDDLDDLDRMSATEQAPEEDKEDEDDDMVNAMLKAQGLDLAGEELDDAISSLIDDMEADEGEDT